MRRKEFLRKDEFRRDKEECSASSWIPEYRKIQEVKSKDTSYLERDFIRNKNNRNPIATMGSKPALAHVSGAHFHLRARYAMQTDQERTSDPKAQSVAHRRPMRDRMS